MALKKSEKRLLGVLGVVILIFLLDRFVLGGDKKTKASVPPKGATKGAAAVPGANTTAPKTAAKKGNQKRIIFKKWGKDPFAYSYATELKKKNTRKRPGPINRSPQPNQQLQKSEQPVAKQEDKGPVLNGILWKDGNAFALINGIIMEEGEEREGLKVIKIRGSEVICRKGNRTFTLEWRESQ